MATTVHAVVRLDAVQATHDGSLLRSLKYMPSSTPTAIENGNFVALKGRLAGEREIWEAITPTTGTTIDAIALVASPEYMVDERKKNLTDFVNEAGDIARGLILVAGDCFSVTAEALDGTPTEGQYIEIKNDQTKGHVAASETASAIVIGKCTAIDKVGNLTYYVIDVNPHVAAGE